MGLSDELETRGGIDTFTDNDDITAEPYNDTGQPAPQSNNQRSDRDDDDEFSNVNPSVIPCGEATQAVCTRTCGKSGSKDTLFAIMCVIICMLGVVAIVIGTAIACGVYNPNAGKNDELPSYFDPETMSVFYDPSGQLHLNVYVEKRPDMNINVTIDEEGNATVDTELLDGQQAGTDSGSGVDDTNSANAGMDNNKPENVVTGKPEDTESDDQNESDANNSDNSDNNSEDNAGTDNNGEKIEAVPNPPTGYYDEMAPDYIYGWDRDPARYFNQKKASPEVEAKLLHEMRQRVARGENRYLPSDVAYVIIDNDTLTEFSRYTGWSIEFLAEYNQINDCDLIYTDNVIRCPGYCS